MDMDGALVSLDALSEVGITDLDPLVIYMQGEDGSFSLPVANVESCNNGPCDDSVDTLVPNEAELGDVQGSLDSSALVLGDSVPPTPVSTEGDGGPLEQRTGLFQLADGQFLYVTYTVDTLLENQVVEELLSHAITLQLVEDCNTAVLPTDGSTVVTELLKDGNNVLLPTELPTDGSTDLLPTELPADGSTVLLPTELPADGSTVLLPTELPEDAASWPDMSLTEVGNVDPRKALQILSSDVGVNERLSLLDAMLAPYPQKEKKGGGLRPEEGGHKGTYACNVCGASFARALKYYDHLNLHSGQYEWKCSTCDKTFGNEYVLRQHRRRDHQQLRPHACPFCPAGFDRASQLMYHQRRIHLDEQPFCCEICGRGFFKRSDLIGHLRLHLGITTFTCKVCGKQFSHTSNLNRHERLHSGVKPYPCIVCGRRFAQLGCMWNHRQSHQADRTVPCPLCKKMFKRVDAVRKHVRYSHQDPQVQYKDLDRILKKKDVGYQARQFHCTVCGETFPQASLLREHEAQHEKENHLQCFSCNQVYKDLDSMKNHACLPSKPTPEPQEMPAIYDDSEELARQLQSLLHEDGDGAEGDIVLYVTQEGQAEPTQVLIKPVVDTGHPALDCGEADDGRVDMAVTLDGVEPINEDTEVLLFDGPPQDLEPIREPEEQENSISNVFPASDDSGSSSVSDPVAVVEAPAPQVEEAGPPVAEEPITNPRDEMHRTPRRPRTYQCPECPKVFNHKFNYKQHLGTHYVDKQMYACTVCRQSFAWRSTLNKHMLSHGGLQPPRFACELCDKKYSNTTLMAEHLKRDHDKQRNHECEVCNKTFYKSYDLKIHKRTHTREKPYKCKTCDKTFNHVSHMIRHERIHSGVRPYCCDVCGRSFIESSLLRHHRSTKCTSEAAPSIKVQMKAARLSAKAGAT